jgi:histidinol phosphatase-like enzyme
MKIYIDVDGVLCSNTSGKYEGAKPIRENIKKINQLYDRGNIIIIWTARGSTSKIDWTDLTRSQLKKWKVKYHDLMDNKPSYDLIIEDRCVNIKDLDIEKIK